MNALIQLRMCELLAVSTEVSNYIHDQTRKRRVPIMNESSDPPSANVVSADSMITQLSAVEKLLYACSSARIKVSLDEEVQMNALLDDESELNIMKKKTFDQFAASS